MTEEINTKTEEINPIPDKVLSWLTVAGFLELYYEYRPQTKTLKQAYQLAEKDYSKAYKRNKYVDYASFLRAKWGYINREMKKRKKERNSKVSV